MGETVRLCPQCGSSDLYPETGFMTGYKYHCRACDYVGAFVVEKDLDEAATEGRGGEEAEGAAAGEEG